MKKMIFAASCALALMAGGAQAQERDIRIAFDVPYAPFEYKDESGELTGFEVELAEAMCDEMEANCEFVIQAWDGMIPGLLARKFDLMPLYDAPVVLDTTRIEGLLGPVATTPYDEAIPATMRWLAERER